MVAASASLENAEVRLRLVIADERIAAVEVHNRRPVGAVGALVGKSPDRIPSLLRRLFPVCGHAHASACEQAIAAARGESTAALRHVPHLLAEMAIAHAWRVLIDWAVLLGRAPGAAALQRVRDAARRLGEKPDEAHAANLAEALGRAVFGPYQPTVPELPDWSAVTDQVAGELIRAVATESVAPPVTRLLSQLTPEWFVARLAADTTFAARPNADGLPAETGPYAACSVAERELFDRNGPLAARLLAMLAVTLHLIARLRGSSRAAGIVAAAAQGDAGCGVAATARGPLAYHVVLEDDRIATLRSVAPTEWVLHPQGVLVQLLRGRSAAGGERLARLATVACDPCALCEVSLDVSTHA